MILKRPSVRLADSEPRLGDYYLPVTPTERRLLWIVIGMVAAFIGIFILIAYIPADRLHWLGGE